MTVAASPAGPGAEGIVQLGGALDDGSGGGGRGGGGEGFPQHCGGRIICQPGSD